MQGIFVCSVFLNQKTIRGGNDMNVPNLLIAESSEEFARSLAAALSGRHQVFFCHNGRDALGLLQELRPEMLVLDLMLPELDGISLLREANSLGLRPRVLALTPLISPYVAESASQLGIGYIIRKPCDIQAAAMRVEDMARRMIQEPPGQDPHSSSSDMLLSLSLLTKHRGYHYLREAVVLMARDPAQSITKELYPAVAEICSSTTKHVERSIRSALSAAWDRRDPAVWVRYFPPGRCPTNAMFISRLAEELRNHPHP